MGHCGWFIAARASNTIFPSKNHAFWKAAVATVSEKVDPGRLKLVHK
jgi:hypothetical protein